MDKLIQTSKCSIIYGTFRGKENQELFRCPRELDDVDLARYINENRALIGFENDDTEDLRNVSGKELIGYWRMYYRGGWALRWFGESEVRPSDIDCAGADKIIEWLNTTFKDGCSFYMKDYFANNYTNWGQAERYLIRPMKRDYYKVMIDTKYGNHDYPVRIYVYRDTLTINKDNITEPEVEKINAEKINTIKDGFVKGLDYDVIKEAASASDDEMSAAYMEYLKNKNENHQTMDQPKGKSV